jgi:penicillin-binding protein 1C
VTAELKRRLRRWSIRLAVLAAGFGLLGLVSFWVLDRVFPFPLEKLSRESALLVSDAEGLPLRMFLPADEIWRLPVELDELPPEVPRALVQVEDRRFYHHPGVDPLAMVRAVWANARAGRVVSGASTISMQVARMIEPKPRTVRSKLIEAFRALQLERQLSKRQVLEAYLNLAPYGGNVEGIGAAAWFYFGKSPGALSLGEVALLTSLPRAPTYYDPARSREAAAEGREFVLGRMLDRSAVAEAAVAHARRQPIPEGRREAPFEAPHLARLVRDRFAPGPVAESRLRSTLDRRVQRVAERSLARRVEQLRRDGVDNASIVVIEIGSRAVRALVGSAGFSDRARQGQVNGAIARRSPGSTLKPFLYAMAIDEGRVVPDSYLLDIPTDFSGYVAQNYDDLYRGRVTVRRALAESLNAPAVRLLSGVGVPRFVDLLRRGGLTTIDRPAGSYGLPLVLGAAEVSLLELTNLYAALAEGGVYRDLRLVEPVAERKPTATRLISREAARLVTEMLLEVERAPGRPAPRTVTGTPGRLGSRDGTRSACGRATSTAALPRASRARATRGRCSSTSSGRSRGPARAAWSARRGSRSRR